MSETENLHPSGLNSVEISLLKRVSEGAQLLDSIEEQFSEPERKILDRLAKMGFLDYDRRVLVPSVRGGYIPEFDDLRLSINGRRAISTPSGLLQPTIPESFNVNPPITVFISHASADRELAAALVHLLKAAFSIPPVEIRCTSVDGYRLPVGTNTDSQLKIEVRDSKVFIGLITPNSITSAYVLFELGARWGANLPLFPVMAAGSATELLRGPLSGITALELAAVSQVYQLLEDIDKGISYSLAGPSSFVRELEQVNKAATMITMPT